MTSDDGWSVRVTITRHYSSPGGTPREQQSGYNYKNGADNEGKEKMRARLHLKAKAKRIAKLDFNPEKKKAEKAKRRKTSAAALVSTTRSGLEAAVEGSEVDSDAGTVDRQQNFDVVTRD